jgi:hypothetical protein
MKRKARRAQAVFKNAMQRAMEGSRLLTEADQRLMNGVLQQSFADFQKGHSCEKAFRDFADAFNVSEVLSELGICSDDESKLRTQGGLHALGAVHQRQQQTGSWTLRTGEMHAMREAIWLHKVQLAHCTFHEFRTARQKVAQRTAQALAGNASPGTTVVEVQCKQAKR